MLAAGTHTPTVIWLIRLTCFDSGLVNRYISPTPPLRSVSTSRARSGRCATALVSACADSGVRLSVRAAYTAVAQ